MIRSFNIQKHKEYGNCIYQNKSTLLLPYFVRIGPTQNKQRMMRDGIWFIYLFSHQKRNAFVIYLKFHTVSYTKQARKEYFQLICFTLTIQT